MSDVFTISAVCGEGSRSATRCRAASAMVLADRWAREGCRNITLSDPEGAVRSREGFRPVLRNYRSPALT